MANWRYTCDINQYLNTDGYPDQDEFTAIRDAVVAELRLARDYRDDEELQAIVADLAASETVADFDHYLNELHGWANWNLVWLGI